jgi:hypothetical protein
MNPIPDDPVTMNPTRALPRLLVLLFGLLTLPASAHEYWLAPLDFSIRPDQPLQVDIRIGQHFKGDTFVYRPSQVAALLLRRGDSVATVSPKLGDMPAISATPVGEGLNILTLSSNLFSVTYYEEDKFPAFLRYDGLDWALAEHQRRKLPATHFTEAYRRHAKALIRVGDGQGDDRRTGLDFEWVMLNNPYTSDDELVAQLWWRDQPAADTQSRLFVRRGEQIDEHVLRTDVDGRVTLPRVPGGSYLLNAVHLMIPDAATVAETQAVWESRWASLTFATPTQ